MCGIDAFSCDAPTTGSPPGFVAMAAFHSGVVGLHSPAII
jgi:hypothetical protein